MNSILSQAKKEWQEFKRDKLSLSLALVLPIFALVLFGYGIKLESSKIAAIFLDYDNTKLSRKLIDSIQSTTMFRTVKETKTSENDEYYELKRNQARLRVVIPKGFARKILREEESFYEVAIDGTDISNAQIIYNTISTVNSSFAKGLREEALKNVEVAEVEPDTKILFNPRREETDFILPGAYGVILWMFPALLAAVCSAKEKEHATIKRLIASEISPHSLIFGKALLYSAVGVFMALLIYLTGLVVFGFGKVFVPLPLLISCLLYVLTAVLFGLTLGISTDSQTTAVQATSTLGFFPCLLLSGFVYPIENIPYPLNLLANLVPAKYYIELARSTLVRDAGFGAVWIDPLALTAFILLFSGLCLYFTKKSLARS